MVTLGSVADFCLEWESPPGRQTRRAGSETTATEPDGLIVMGTQTESKSEPRALQAALAYHRAGYSILPIKADGSKSPDLPTWKLYATRCATESVVRSWYPPALLRGIGIIGGAVSGNLEMIDFDLHVEANFPAWREMVEAEVPGLADRLPIVQTPREPPGYHVYLRCDEGVSGNTILARTSEGKTAIETRGEGGYVLAPGCPGECHPTGREYRHIAGPPVSQTPIITTEERAVLLRCARMLDRAPADTPEDSSSAYQDGELKPGADFNHRGTPFPDLLDRHNWTVFGPGLLTRPGKSKGASATYDHCVSRAHGWPLLKVFTSNAHPFEENKCYSRFAAYALLEHGGDFGKAAAELRRSGYGGDRQAEAPNSKQQPGQTEDNKSEAWGDILPLGQEPSADPFPLDVLPEALQEYVRQVSHCMNMPTCHVALAMLTVAGAAIGNARQLRINASHEQHPALYSAIVSPPGTRKSPLLSLIAKPLHIQQAAWRKRWEQRIAEWEKAKKDADDGETPPKPILRRIVTTNATVESLILLMNENQRGLLLLKDELSGLVASLNQYKGGRGDDRQAFLEFWSGTSVDVDRKSDKRGDSLHVEKPCLAILGGLQPAVLDSLSGKSIKGGNGPDDGYFDRWLPSYPNPFPAVGDDGRDIDLAVLDKWQSVCDLLLALGMTGGDMSDPEAWGGPCHVCMTQEGRAVWRDFTTQIATEMNEVSHPDEAIPGNPGIPGTPVGVWSKLTGHAGRFAIIMHYLRYACDGTAVAGAAGQQIIDAADMTAAVKIACWLKSHLRKVHFLSGQDEKISRARVIVSHLLRVLVSGNSSFKRWQLHKCLGTKLFPTADALDAPLEILLQRNYLRRIEQVRKTPGGRAPEPVWEINPLLSSTLGNSGNSGNWSEAQTP